MDGIRTEMLVGGHWVMGEGEPIDDLDPSTGRVIARVASASAADVDAAILGAADGLSTWGRLPAARRGAALTRVAELLERDQESISRLESADNGRPRRETAAQAAIVAKWFRYYGGMADKVQGSVIPVEGPYLNYTERVPVGVCAALTPWNHPMLIATKKIAPALACGNAIVVKPSELAPLSVLTLARLGEEAGLPPGVLSVLTGGPETGQALIEHPGVDRIDLTGSTATGIAVARTAAAGLKRVGLELGGKAANLVFADTNWERTVAGVVFSGFIAQGQSCVAGARILVEDSIADDFAEAVRERVERIRLGDPQQRSTQMGPLITAAAAQRVAGHVETARREGAEVLCGGGVPEDLPKGIVADAYYRPTLIRTGDESVTATREEIFGPVVTIMAFRDEEEAIEIANSVPFGLGAGVWTRDVSRAHRVAARLRAGVTWINDYHRIDPASPWGGFGLSGYGRENGFDAVVEYTATKSVWVPTEPQSMDWYEDDAPGMRLN